MKKNISRLSAVVVLISTAVAFVSFTFFKCVMLNTYMNIAGANYCLPIPTTFALKITSTVSLSVIFIIFMFTLGASEYRLKKEHQRFLVQIGCITVLLLFFAFLMWAFALPMYIPEVTIIG